jgi:hypothetical protein
MEQLTSKLLLGKVAAGFYADIRDEVSAKYQIPVSDAVSKRIAYYAGLMGGALQVQMECAILENRQTFEITGTMAHITGVYPFEVFRPYMEEVARSLCPGTQITFGEPKPGRFLAQDMRYLPFKVTLPTEPVLAYPSGLSAKRITYDVYGGGRSTGYMRYPHMYRFMHNHRNELPSDRPANILLLGAGLIQDPDGSIQCPQLHEIGALAQCAKPARGFQITVSDNDADLIDRLKANFEHPGDAVNRIRYDANAITYLMQSNEFDNPDEYENLRAAMFEGMTLFSQKANVHAVEADLYSYSHPSNSGEYEWVIATSSITNVFRNIDRDAVETNKMIQILGNYIRALHVGGYLFVDEFALRVIEDRLGKGTIPTVILPLLEYAGKSELSVTLIDRPVAKQDGMATICTYVRQGNELYKSPVVTHRVYAIKRGAPKDEFPKDAITKLQEHQRTSVKYA